MNQRANKLCPECKSNLFQFDEVHDELTCRNCGLVIIAPIMCGLYFPGYYLSPRSKKSHLLIKHLDQVVRVFIELNF